MASVARRSYQVWSCRNTILPSCSPASRRSSAAGYSVSRGPVDVHVETLRRRAGELGELLVAAHRRADDLELLEEQPGQVDLDLRPRRAAAHDEPATRLQRSHRLLPRRRPDALDHDVGLDVPSLGGGVDGRRRHPSPAPRPLGRAAAGGDDLGTEVTGEASAAHDTPEPMPTTSTVWPACTRARRSMRYAVRTPADRRRIPPTPGRRPARRCATGRPRLGVATPAVLAVDREPGAHRAVDAERDDVRDRRDARVDHHLVADGEPVTPSPTASTTPATSHPGTCGSGGFGHAPGHPQVHVVEGAGDHLHPYVVGRRARAGRSRPTGTRRATRRGSMRAARPSRQISMTAPSGSTDTAARLVPTSMPSSHAAGPLEHPGRHAHVAQSRSTGGARARPVGRRRRACQALARHRLPTSTIVDPSVVGVRPVRRPSAEVDVDRRDDPPAPEPASRATTWATATKWPRSVSTRSRSIGRRCAGPGTAGHRAWRRGRRRHAERAPFAAADAARGKLGVGRRPSTRRAAPARLAPRLAPPDRHRLTGDVDLAPSTTQSATTPRNELGRLAGPSRVAGVRATCASWRSRSISCFIVRTKSPPPTPRPRPPRRSPRRRPGEARAMNSGSAPGVRRAWLPLPAASSSLIRRSAATSLHRRRRKPRRRGRPGCGARTRTPTRALASPPRRAPSSSPRRRHSATSRSLSWKMRASTGPPR